MISHKTVEMAAGIVLGLASLLHLYRVVFGLAISVGFWQVPMFLSIIAFIVCGPLSFLLLKNALKK